MERREKERLGAGELPQFVDYEMRRAEIDARRIETARVARKSPSYQSSLPKYNPNKGQVQELDALRIENILTTSYPQESWDTSSRRVPSFLPASSHVWTTHYGVRHLPTDRGRVKTRPQSTCRLL